MKNQNILNNIILKSCPFCGNAAKSHMAISEWSDARYRIAFDIYCTKCGIEKCRVVDAEGKSFDILIDSMNEVINDWNNRSIDTKIEDTKPVSE